MSILTNKSVITMTIAFGIVFAFGLFVGMWSTGFLARNPECFEPTSSTASSQIMQPTSDVRLMYMPRNTLEEYRVPDEIRIDSSIVVFDKTTYFLSGYGSPSSKMMTFYEDDKPVGIILERYVNGKKFESQTQTKPSNPKQIVAIYHAGDTAKILINTNRYKSPI